MSVQSLMLAVVALNNRQYSYLQLLLLWGLSDLDYPIWLSEHKDMPGGKSPRYAHIIGRVKKKLSQQPTHKLTSSSVHHSSH